MIMHSLRARLAAFTMLVAAVTVLLALGITWVITVKSATDQLDRALESMQTRLLERAVLRGLDHFEERARSEFQSPWGTVPVLRIIPLGAEVGEFQSEQWPGDLGDTVFSRDIEGLRPRVGARRILRKPPFGAEGLPPDEAWGAMHGPPPPEEVSPTVLRSVRAGGTEWRAAVLVTRDFALVAAFDLAPVVRERDRLAAAMGVALCVAVALAMAASTLFSRYLLAPLGSLGATIARAGAGALDTRVPFGGEALEFRDLIEQFNGMMDRLERSFSNAQRFTADAAHELRTPLTVLQGRLEERLQRPDLQEEEQVFLGGMVDEVAMLKAIVEKLLLLSQSDSQTIPVQPEIVDIAALLRETCDDLRLLSPGREITCEAPRHLPVRTDPGLVAMILQNLASNARNHGTAEGFIECSARPTQGGVEVTVANPGTGIPEEQRELIFDRFFRVDKARSRAMGGAGLGLALSRELARALGGDLELLRGEPGRIEFRFRLPG